MANTGVLSYRDFAEKLTKVYQIPGIAVGLGQDGEPIYTGGFGYRNVEQQLPITPDTLFGIGSITKSFTCVAILQLADAGKLSVDDLVTHYLPEFRTPNAEYTKQMTIHHFMTHSSGLPPLPTLGHALAKSVEGDPAAKSSSSSKASAKQAFLNTYEELMDYIASLDFELLGPPGQTFSYSNDAYALLGTIIERASGQSYVEYMDSHILRPAGMSRSTFSPQVAACDANAATLYARRGDDAGDGAGEVYAAPIWWDAPTMLAAGFLKSTTSDMLRYAEIYRNGGVVGDERILSAESVGRMMKPYIECDPDRYYGYGLMITPNYHGTMLVDHGGALKGIAAQLTVLPEKGITGVALANLAGVPSFDILLGAINERLGLSVDSRRVAFALKETSSAALERFAGEYASGEDMKVKISDVEGEMQATLDGKAYPVHQVDDCLFVALTSETQQPMKFLVDAAGRTTGMYFHYRILAKVNG